MIAGLTQFNGDSFDATKISFINKTGAQLVKGAVYALDLARTDPTSISPRSSLGNLVGVAAGNLQGILVVAEQATNPNDFGLGTVFGPVNALVNGGQASAVNEVQTVAINGTLSAGTYTISFVTAAGVLASTAPIAYNASLATVQAALDGVSGGANFIVAGGTAETAMTLTFSGTGYAGLAGGHPDLHHAPRSEQRHISGRRANIVPIGAPLEEMHVTFRESLGARSGTNSVRCLAGQ